MEWRVARPKTDGTTAVLNLDLGAKPIWWEFTPKHGEIKNGSIIVLKIPGSTGWSGRGETKYSGAYFQVLRVLRLDDHGNYICEPVIDFPLRAK